MGPLFSLGTLLIVQLISFNIFVISHNDVCNNLGYF